MATQQILFAETIAGMKKAFKRKAYESDSDSEIENYGNRGHKLKRRARFSHRGQLVPTDGPSTYKETVDYAGVRRSIISRNPPLVDEDGYGVDSEDDEERVENAMISAAELNPYANIRIEHILAPLTASTDLPTHPTISKPFTSQNLTELVSQSAMMMRRENHSLWQVRHLFTALCGDHTWVPCESMISSNDIELFTDDHVARHLLSLSKPPIATYGASSAAATINGDGKGENDGARIAAGNEVQDVPMTDGASLDPNRTETYVEKNAQNQDISMKDDVENPTIRKASAAVLRTAPEASGNVDTGLQNGNSVEQDVSKNHNLEDASNNQESESGIATRTALGQTARSLTSDEAKEPFIHPMFLPPMHTKTDRDVGLPEQEAEDVRRLLALFVQKQEEVCRGVNKLYNGLNKAQRLRQDVLHWSKAEAHSGPNRDMSDGEDWYDKEEWGLTEDLKKGQDDEEEDTTATTKKTRNRR